jgi:hypothetical protein
MSGFVFREEYRFPEVIPAIVQAGAAYVVGALQKNDEVQRNILFFRDIYAAYRLLSHTTGSKIHGLLGEYDRNNKQMLFPKGSYVFRSMFAGTVESVSRLCVWQASFEKAGCAGADLSKEFGPFYNFSIIPDDQSPWSYFWGFSEFAFTEKEDQGKTFEVVRRELTKSLSSVQISVVKPTLPLRGERKLPYPAYDLDDCCFVR